MQSKILLVDIGNTQIKWAWRDALASVQIYRYDLEQLEMPFAFEPKPSVVFIAHVATEAVLQALQTWIQQQWAVPVFVVQTPARAPLLRNGYTQPHSLGIDRWLAMLALRVELQQSKQQPLVVVQCGSALTVDLVDAAGQHLGGYLLPGLERVQQLMCEWFHCERLPLPEKLTPGKSTAENIVQGSLLMAISLLESLPLRLSTLWGDDTILVMTGGNAEFILAQLTTDHGKKLAWHYRAHLVLHGLAHYADESLHT